MSSFVLVHGSWHGAWCWYKVAPRLRGLGHEVFAVDMPGHGRDPKPPQGIGLGDYVDTIVKAVDCATEPVVLVGHSRGGIAISQAGEARPDRIATLTYLAAYLLRSGETVLDVAAGDADSLVIPALEFDPEGAWDMLREDAFEPALYADCVAEDIALAHALLTPEPFAPTVTPLNTTPERYGSIPRVYIELLQDRAVSLRLQRQMHAATPCARVLSIDASHSAYFSRPDELAALLHDVPAPPARR